MRDGKYLKKKKLINMTRSRWGHNASHCIKTPKADQKINTFLRISAVYMHCSIPFLFGSSVQGPLNPLLTETKRMDTIRTSLRGRLLCL